MCTIELCRKEGLPLQRVIWVDLNLVVSCCVTRLPKMLQASRICRATSPCPSKLCDRMNDRKMTGRFLCEINHLNDRLKFAVKPYNDIAYSKSIAKTTFFSILDASFFYSLTEKDCKTTNRKGSISGRFAVTNLKNDQSETQKRSF